MKLEKREITLNEQDSFLDMYYLEKLLFNEYEKGISEEQRKESNAFLQDRLTQIAREMKTLITGQQKTGKG